MKRVLLLVLLLVSATAFYLRRDAFSALTSPDVEVPTAPVRKGDLTITMKARGDVKGEIGPIEQVTHARNDQYQL